MAADKAEAAPVIGLNVDDLLPNVDRAYLLANMRAQPLQPRALVTVERIVGAARRVGLVAGYENLTLQAVAEAANVRLGAIYRYFSTPDDLIRMMVRLWIAGQFNRYRVKIAASRFDSIDAAVDDLAAAIDKIVHLDEMEPGVSKRLILRLLRDYHEIPFAEQWAMAGDVRAKLLADGLAVADDADAQARLAMAFAATGAFAKMTILHAPHMRLGAHFRDNVRRMFREALLPVDRIG